MCTCGALRFMQFGHHSVLSLQRCGGLHVPMTVLSETHWTIQAAEATMTSYGKPSTYVARYFLICPVVSRQLCLLASSTKVDLLQNSYILTSDAVSQFHAMLPCLFADAYSSLITCPLSYDVSTQSNEDTLDMTGCTRRASRHVLVQPRMLQRS